MLIKPNINQINKYKDFAYELSQDLSKSSFPTYLDSIKTKEDFMKTIDYAIDNNHIEILLYLEDDEVLGFIQYYYLKEDKYIGFDIFNIKRNINQAIDEFLEYINERYNDYQINFGFPLENKDAINHLEKIGFIKTEDSNLFILNMNEYEITQDNKNIVEVNKDNFDDFKILHDKQDIYWNSDRLYKAIQKQSNNWYIYLYYEDNKPIGNIYFTYIDNMMEIFGIDIIEDHNIAKNLLIHALNKTKEDGIEYVVFFVEDRESNITKEIGFNYICRYNLYVNKEY